SPLREAAFSGLLAQWALEDPLQAIDKWHANSDMFPDSIDPTIFLRAVFRSPGLRDPEDIIMRLPESVRDQAVMAYASEYAAQAPEETFHVVAGQPPGVERDRALQLSLSHWASEEPNEVAAWVTTLEE